MTSLLSATLPNITDDVLKAIVWGATPARDPKSQFSDLEIIEKDIKIGTKAGDNYLGTIFRVNVKYSNASNKPQDLQLIIKTLDYENPEWRVPAEMKVYEKESFCYTVALPLLNLMCRDYKFGPQCYYTQEKPIRMIAMEDLKEQGFVMVDRTVGIDFEHCSLVLKKLAAFHVTSMSLNRRLMDAFTEGMCTLDVLTDAYRGYLTGLVSTVESWNDLQFKDIIPKLKLIRDNYKQVFLMPFNTDKDSFRVLNHGDIWVNNFLYKYDGGKPVDVQFLDYQMCFYTSPGYDLNYFLMMNPNYETRLTREADLLEVYREEFNRKLKELNNCEPGFSLTRELLKQIMAEKALYGFNIMMSLLPAIIRDTQSTDDSTAMFKDENEKRRIIQKTFQNEKFTSYLKFYLRKFNDLGTLDLDLK